MAQDKETPQQSLTITREDLTAMITAAINAAKAPNVVEQAKLDAQQKQIQSDQEARLRISKDVLSEIEGRKWIKKTCSHEHKNGDTHCVHVQEKHGAGYLLCQKNQCIIRPGTPSPNYKGSVIYSTELFNQVFQKLPGGEVFG